MRQAVSYWTGIWDPAREAISKEASLLRNALCPKATVVSFSNGQSSSVGERGVVRLSGKRWLTLRALAAALEPQAAVSHVFGELDAWHLLRSVGRRPVVFTAVVDSALLDARAYDSVRVFAVESEALASRLRSAGVTDDRIRVVYPGVDLAHFRPGVDRAAEPFTVVFASSPSDPSHLERRGIPLVVEAARACPDVRFVLLMRKWGATHDVGRALDALEPTENVDVIWRDVTDMAAVYQVTHAAILLNAPGYGKSCPNSIVEGLACGCPAIVSRSCGIAPLIAEANAGTAVERTPEAVVDGIADVRRTWTRKSAAARQLAERLFDVETFVDIYRDIYRRLSQPPIGSEN